MKIYVFVVAAVVLFSCTPKDSDIKKIIAVNAKEDLMYAGVNYDVHEGVVTLSGNSPSVELKNKLIERLKATGGIKKVVDNIVIGPVVLDNDFVLKQKADSILAGYASVESLVKNGVITLNGEAKQKELQQITKSLSSLPASSIVNNLSTR